MSTTDWSLMEQVRAVLRPFKVATEALSTPWFPTASAVLPLKFVLLSQLQTSPDDPAAIREMKTKISDDLAKRYGQDKDAYMLLNSASCLDPRFHLLVHLTRDQQLELREKVKKELIAIAEQKEGDGGNEAVDCQHQDTTALSAMGDLFGDIYSQRTNTNCDRALHDVIQQEMTMYERETPLPTHGDPLAWWKTAQVRFPHIALLARRYLSIPGTSLRAETVFSTAGIVADKKRSALNPENVDRLVFLANNLNI